MKRLAILLIVCACRTTSEAESHMAASAANTLDATAHTETHVDEAPTKTTTTVEEFAAPNEKGGSVSEAAFRPSPVGVPVLSRDSPIAHAGHLVKRTVTVEERGQVVTDTHADLKSQERGDSTLSSESETKKTRDFLHGPFALLGGLVALAGVAFAAFKILKPRLLP